jgi:acetyltransferase-like isoleucine patch superfamily enzyme
MALRGLIYTRKLVFLGKGSRIRQSSQFLVGSGVEIGIYSQLDCLSRGGITMGHGSKIGAFSLMSVSGTLRDLGDRIVIGDHVGIGDYAHIGGAGGVSIGDHTITGAYLSIHPENHNFSDSRIPISEQGVSRRGISIGRDCWLGAKVTILDGTKIGNGCIVAAGAVVSGEFGDNLVIGGVPARVLKPRAE